jgi:hypothetical protein
MSTVRTWDLSAEGSVLDVQHCAKGSSSLLIASMQVLRGICLMSHSTCVHAYSRISRRSQPSPIRFIEEEFWEHDQAKHVHVDRPRCLESQSVTLPKGWLRLTFASHAAILVMKVSRGGQSRVDGP